MESPVSPVEAREAAPYRGEAETPVSASLGAVLAGASALVVVLSFTTDFVISQLRNAAIAGLSFGVVLVFWALARGCARLRWIIGVPAKKQVIAQVRRGMVNGGYLPHDMALWSPRRFKCRLRPRYKVVEVSYSGSMLKPPFDLGDYLMETHASDALDIATIVEDPLPARWGGVKLVLRYSLEDEEV